MTAPRDFYICPKCRSTKIERQCWQPMNATSPDEGDTDAMYCPECDSDVHGADLVTTFDSYWLYSLPSPMLCIETGPVSVDGAPIMDRCETCSEPSTTQPRWDADFLSNCIRASSEHHVDRLLTVGNLKHWNREENN